MRIAIYAPEKSAMSYKIIREKVWQFLESKNHTIIPFAEPDNVPTNAEMVWDPNAGGGFIPNIRKDHTHLPIVATIHGARLFALPVSVLKTKEMPYSKIIKSRLLQKRYWKEYIIDYEAFVTVSDYSSHEFKKHLNIPDQKLHRIYNAVDHEVFKPTEKDRQYLLHISEYQPVKNVDRIIKAYIKAAKKEDLPEFWIMSRGFPYKNIHPKIKILDDKYRTNEELSKLYQQAIAFVFPTLHEGFGIPIIEAMASGTPVITSNTTACHEVSDDAAITVNPKSIKQIKKAIIEITKNNNLRKELTEKGIKRAQQFTWENTGTEYENLFKSISQTQ